MDSICYHKWQIKNIPISSNKKQEIIDWLITCQISFSDELYKPKLLELVKNYKEKILFACIEIAKQYGHQVFFTSPYYCEL